MKTPRMKPCVLGTFALVVLGTSGARAEWYSAGDYVVTTAETGLMSGTNRVRTLDSATNFRVDEVRGNWVALREKVDGQDVRGWVKNADIMKIGREYRALYATKDSLTHNQSQFLKLPKSLPVTVVYRISHPVDIFVISEEGLSALKWVAKNGSGQMSSRFRELNSSSGSFEWAPPNNEQYYVLIDNTSFPDGGANGGQSIEYSLAYCRKDPKPEKPRTGRGLLIGQATLEFDNYEGRNGRFRKQYDVVIEIFEKDNDSNAKTVAVPTDRDGYFFLANTDPNRQYRVIRIQSGSMEAPVSAFFSFSFRGSKNKDQSVRDAGCYTLRVRPNGKLQTRITTPETSVETQKDGTMTVLFSGADSPLDRHEWFLAKFPNSGWADKVEKDRDAIYMKRAEDARKKEEKKRKKEKSSATPSTKPAQ